MAGHNYPIQILREKLRPKNRSLEFGHNFRAEISEKLFSIVEECCPLETGIECVFKKRTIVGRHQNHPHVQNHPHLPMGEKKT